MNDELKTRVGAALERLNWLYGRGEVKSVDFDSQTFVRQPGQMIEEVRRFRFDNGTVYSLGRQQKVAA